MQPGDTITPHEPHSEPGDLAGELKINRDSNDRDNAPAEKPTPENKPPSPIAPVPAPVVMPEQVHKDQEPEPEPPAEPTPWRYAQGYEDTSLSRAPEAVGPVTWTASEFVDHEKAPSWFTGLAALTGATVTIIYLITRDVITVIVIALAAVLFGITASRKPRTLQYQLTSTGVSIGNRFIPYQDLKTFSVLEEGAFNSIQLTPLKRFMPPISLYYPPEQEEQIITMLGSYLPHEDRAHDPIDRLMRKVRF